MQILELTDGRKLAYEDGGDSTGIPVMFQHGTGDSRLARHPDDALTASLGIRLITVDRPGVGGSTPRKGHTLLDWVPDIEMLADALALDRFAVAGWSGGGPYALAIAHELGDRITRVALASPLAPFDQPGARDLVENKDLQMIWKLNHMKLLAAAAAKAESRYYRKHLSGFVDHIVDDASTDKPVLTDPMLRPMFEEEMGEALAQGGVGVLDDMWAFLDWGFKPEDVGQHVELFFGDSDQILNPQMASVLRSRLPDCAGHSWTGSGHYGVFAHWQEFLESLT